MLYEIMDLLLLAFLLLARFSFGRVEIGIIFLFFAFFTLLVFFFLFIEVLFFKSFSCK